MDIFDPEHLDVRVSDQVVLKNHWVQFYPGCIFEYPKNLFNLPMADSSLHKPVTRLKEGHEHSVNPRVVWALRVSETTSPVRTDIGARNTHHLGSSYSVPHITSSSEERKQTHSKNFEASSSCPLLILNSYHDICFMKLTKTGMGRNRVTE